MDIANIRLGAAYSYTGFEQEMAFSQNIAYDPFAVGQNRAVYGSLEDEDETVATPDSARSSVVSEEDEGYVFRRRRGDCFGFMPLGAAFALQSTACCRRGSKPRSAIWPGLSFSIACLSTRFG